MSGFRSRLAVISAVLVTAGCSFEIERPFTGNDSADPGQSTDARAEVSAPDLPVDGAEVRFPDDAPTDLSGEVRESGDSAPAEQVIPDVVDTVAPDEVSPGECLVADDCAPALGPPKLCHKWECELESGLGVCLLVHNDGAWCEDGDQCTVGDACQGGFCTPGGELECVPSGPCRESSCDPFAGCVEENITGSCDDGDACTDSDHCVMGECKGAVVKCDDSNFCTDDSCDPLDGCMYEFNTKQCNDKDPCTGPDTCQEGQCVGVDVGCQCQNDQDCEALPSWNWCAGKPHCKKVVVPHVCKPLPGTAVECPQVGGPGAECVKNECLPETGECELLPVNDGGACDIGNKCNLDAHCMQGVCQGGLKVDCDDFDPCTQDECNPAEGCTYTPLPNCAPCIEEGNQFSSIGLPGDPSCCPGLQAIPVCEPSACGPQDPGCDGCECAGSAMVCSQCPNGVCEDWENICNCEKDCEASAGNCKEKGGECHTMVVNDLNLGCPENTAGDSQVSGCMVGEICCLPVDLCANVQCPAGMQCYFGVCTLNPGVCQGIPFQGCCDGVMLKYCTGDKVVKTDCTSNPACGWNPDKAFYDCGTKGEPDPSGQLPLACPSGCVPQCGDKMCGNDGCGGSCGSCPPNMYCKEGMCI